MAASWKDRLEATVGWALVGLAEQPPLRGLLERPRRGEPRVDAGLRVLLALRQLLGAEPTSRMGYARARRVLRRDAVRHQGQLADVAEVRELTLPLPSGPGRARLYVPAGAPAKGPLWVYFHGGGFVLGDLEMYEAPCRLLCASSGVRLLSVEYALAPEHPFPAPGEDAWAAFCWAVANAAALDADPARIGVGGDSAGGNLSAVLCRRALDSGGPMPALQILIYPAVDRTTEYPSLARYASGFLIHREEIEYYHATYTGDSGAARSDLRISPLLGDLSGQPPAVVVTAGLDPLCDEGDAYAAKLQAAGVECDHLRFDGVVHGFLNLAGLSRASRAAAERIGRAAGQRFGALAPG